MHDQTNYIIRAHKKFKGTKLEENNINATRYVRTMVAYFQIINLRILKWLI